MCAELTAEQMFRSTTATPSYAIAVENVCGMLKTHVEFANRQAANAQSSSSSSSTLSSVSSLPEVVKYDCTDASYEQFGTIFRVMTRHHVTEQEIANNQGLLDYYGPFAREQLLIDLAAVPGLTEEEEANEVNNMSVKQLKTFITSSGLQFNDCIEKSELQQRATEAQSALKKKSMPSSATKSSKSDANEQTESTEKFDEEVIICESHERAVVVANIAKTLGLPYIPFKMIFIEGDWIYSGGDASIGATPEHLPLTIVWLSFGDYDNIFTCSSTPGLVVSDPPSTLAGILDNINEPESYYDEPKSTEKGKAKLLATNPGDIIPAMDVTEMHIKALEVASTNTSSAMNRVFGYNDARNYDPLIFPESVIYLPGSTKEYEDNKSDDDNSLYHLNEEGKTCFSKEEAKRASEYVVSIGFDQRIKQSIQSMRFQLPQQSTTTETTAQFCNESIYGSLNVLKVEGVCKFDPNWNVEKREGVKRKMKEVNLTEWPTKKQRNDTESSVSSMVRDYDY